VAGVAQFELKTHLGNAVFARVGAAGNDIDMLLAEGVGHIAQQARTVKSNDFDSGPEQRQLTGNVPVDVNNMGLLFGHQRDRIGAVSSVHTDAAAASEKAHDLIAGHRGATARQTNVLIVLAFYPNTRFGAWSPLEFTRSTFGRGWHDRLVRLVRSILAGDLLHKQAWHQVSVADRGQCCVQIRVAVRLQLLA
jgi:hypothetical protein